MGSLHSTRFGRSFFAALGIAFALNSLATGRAAAGDELPRYKLKVGQELVYRTTDPPKESDDGAGGKISRQSLFEWIVDVVDGNPESGWWLVFRQKLTVIYIRAGKEQKQELEMDGHFRLSADGRFAENSTIGAMSNPTSLFPSVPADTSALRDGWNASLALDETHRKFYISPDAAAGEDEFRFVEEPRAALDVIYEQTNTRRYVFDRQSGLVRKVQTTYKQGWPADRPEESVQTIELAETRELDTSDVAALADQARTYFAAVEEYNTLMARARHDFKRTAMTLIEAEKAFQSGTEKLTFPWLKALAEGRLKQHEREAQYMIPDSVTFAKLIDQPSQEWKTTDLDGQPHALVDYRGKVVVLDFWYRGCGWCIRAMPQMKQLTDDFKGQNVAILGINSDRDLDDARYVIDKLGLNYPTLKNLEGPGQINTMYKIHGWPTLVMIDKKGVVRHIHFGYSPSLRSDIGEMIRNLLAEAGD